MPGGDRRYCNRDLPMAGGYHRPVPNLRRPTIPSTLRSARSRAPAAPKVVVLGDLALDVVIVPDRPLEVGSDVPGRVSLRQGGSAASTARWLARLGIRTTLICAVGRDPVGRALVESIRGDGVAIKAKRVAGARTAQVAVLVSSDGERSFVTDRGAADFLRPDDLQPAVFADSAVLHLPAYSLLGEPLGSAGQRGIELARAAGALVTVDLASAWPLLGRGRRFARNLVAGARPDVLFAAAAEARALLGKREVEQLLDYAPVVVIKRGAKGASVLTVEDGVMRRFEVATSHLTVADTTGAGDVFDAGFIAGWLSARAAGRSVAAGLQRAAVAGHAAARRYLLSDRPGLVIG